MPRMGGGVGEGDGVRTFKKRSTSMKMRRLRGEGVHKMPGGRMMRDSEMKKPKLGSGGRFKALAKKVKSPALAAWIGRRKYGAKKFASLARKGK